MKKKSLIERKRTLKEAYLNELKKLGVIDTPKVKKPSRTSKTTVKKEDK